MSYVVKVFKEQMDRRKIQCGMDEFMQGYVSKIHIYISRSTLVICTVRKENNRQLFSDST